MQCKFIRGIYVNYKAWFFLGVRPSETKESVPRGKHNFALWTDP